MKKISIWKDTVSPSKETVMSNTNNKTDVLIIGGGLTGLSTAYFLKDSKLDVSLIDKDRLGYGVTGNTTAKISYMQGTIYQELAKTFSLKTSRLYLDSQLEAIKLVENIVKREKIDCDLEKVDSFLFATEDKNINKIEKEKEILQGFDIKCGEVNSLPIPFPIRYGIVTKAHYVFHPLKYLLGIKKIIEKKINISEMEMVLEVTPDDDKYIVKTSKRVIEAKYVIVACHYPFFLIPGFIPLKNHIKREYVNAAPYSNKNNFIAVNVDSDLHSIRFYKDYIIYGSNEQQLTSDIDYQKNYQKSQRDFEKYFSSKPTYSWMNQDLVTNDKLPLIGVINKKQPNLLLATGYQAWGMTNGTIAGKIVSDLILKKENNYIELFSIKRINTTSILESILNGLRYSKVYFQTYLNRNPSFYDKNVYVTSVKGTNYGVYIDPKGDKHIVKNLCPHMKCKLVFNKEEKSWDCPCHGSRFNIDGKVIEGPANYSIEIDK